MSIVFIVNNLSAQSQLNHSVGLNSSYRGFNYPQAALSFNGEYQLEIKNLVLSSNLGFERWYVKTKNRIVHSFDKKPVYTPKVEIYAGYKKHIFKSPFFLSGSVGMRFYPLRNMADSISLTSRFPFDDDNLNLSTTSKAYSKMHGDELSPGMNIPNKAWGYNVTSMRYALLAKIDGGYEFGNLSVRAFILPYWIVMNYENKADPTISGRKYYFFYDVGLGVNCMLPNKKKETKQ